MDLMRKSSQHRESAALAVFVVFGLTVMAAASDATSFVEPDNWSVGDAFSTYQEWDIYVSSVENPPDVGYLADPPIVDPPTCSALPPGFLSSTNNFYAFGGDYTVEAAIFNHDANAPVGYGTMVRVQAAATQNPDFEQGVVLDSVHLVQPDRAPITGGANDDICHTELLFSGIIGSPYGDVVQDEWLFVFWLPDFVGDFKVVMDCYVHCSFVALRVDTLNAATSLCPLKGDLDCDGAVGFGDINPFVLGLLDPVAYAASFPDCDIMNGDINVDGEFDFADINPFVNLLTGT